MTNFHVKYPPALYTKYFLASPIHLLLSSTQIRMQRSFIIILIPFVRDWRSQKVAFPFTSASAVYVTLNKGSCHENVYRVAPHLFQIFRQWPAVVVLRDDTSSAIQFGRCLFKRGRQSHIKTIIIRVNHSCILSNTCDNEYSVVNDDVVFLFGQKRIKR